MASNTVQIRAADAMKRQTLVVSIKGVPIWRARVRLGLQLIRLAVWVMGCGLRVEDEEQRHE